MFNSRVPSRFVRGTLAAFFALFSLVLAAAESVAQAVLPDVIAARVSTTPERGRLVLDLSGMTEFAVVSLREPDRIAIDIRAASVKTIAPQPVSGQGIVASFTTAVAEEGRVRVELTLAAPSMVQQAYLLEPVGDQPARLVVDLIATTAEDFAARAAADLAAALGSTVPHAIEEAPSQSSEAVSAPPSSEPVVSEPPPASSEPPPSEAPVAAPVTEAPVASRPLVVLDPGHGGVDNGASAPSGIHEKGIVLAFALQLRDLLVASGKFDVALTRDEDTYLTLNERVDLARQNKADLFISLHADTFQQADIRGASIYTRDERATDILDKVLADGENRVDIVAGYVDPADVKQPVVDILVDLMRRQVRQQAFVAANDIVKAMEPSVTLRRFPVRQADFFVLQAPEIPSLLIELGFMSNAADIQNLESESWRDKVVSAIAEGVEQYFASLQAAQ